MTFHELAAILEVEQPTHVGSLTRVSSLSGADEQSVVFATDAKTIAEALRSEAGAILVPATLWTQASSDDPRVLPVADPRHAFALIASRMVTPLSMTTIHATAVVAPDARIGAGTIIGPFTVVERDVLVGERCVIGPHATLHGGTTLGDRVVVQTGAVLGSTGFGYARNATSGAYLLFPQQGTLFVGDDVEVGANTTIDRGALGETRIGRGTKIDNLVHIGHNCLIGEDVIIAAQTGISGSSVIEDRAILGGQVGVGEHATVGRGVILGGGAGVLTGKKMSGPGQIFWGRPARPLKEYLRDLARLRSGGRGSRPVD